MIGEIGTRIALGTDRGSVFLPIVGRECGRFSPGLVSALLAAFGLTRLLSSLLHGANANDPMMFAGVEVGSGIVAFLANYLPARRAIRIDPMMALREE